MCARGSVCVCLCFSGILFVYFFLTDINMIHGIGSNIQNFWFIFTKTNRGPQKTITPLGSQSFHLQTPAFHIVTTICTNDDQQLVCRRWRIDIFSSTRTNEIWMVPNLNYTMLITIAKFDEHQYMKEFNEAFSLFPNNTRVLSYTRKKWENYLEGPNSRVKPQLLRQNNKMKYISFSHYCDVFLKLWFSALVIHRTLLGIHTKI